MDEKDYIELQTLLTKLRIVCFKTIGNPNTITRIREENYRIVRNIDYIRRVMPLKLDMEETTSIKIEREEN